MKNEIKFPDFDWKRVTNISSVLLALSLLVALMTRSGTILRLVQFLDIAIILFLFAVVVASLVKRYNKPNEKPKTQ